MYMYVGFVFFHKEMMYAIYLVLQKEEDDIYLTAVCRGVKYFPMLLFFLISMLKKPTFFSL